MKSKDENEHVVKNLHKYLELELNKSKSLLALASRQLKLEFAILILMVFTAFTGFMLINLVTFLLFWIVYLHGMHSINTPLRACHARLDGAFAVLEILGHIDNSNHKGGKKDRKEEKESMFEKAMNSLKGMLRRKSYGFNTLK